MPELSTGVVRMTYAEAVQEIAESLDEADQQANVDAEVEGYPSAEELTNAQLIEEWLCQRDEKLELADPQSNPNG
jgi:hypothetical protein